MTDEQAGVEVAEFVVAIALLHPERTAALRQMSENVVRRIG